MTIRLDSNLQRFTAGEHPDFRYLGTVQRGLEMGALALTPKGEYVQVNGDIIQTLNTSRVRAALGSAHTSRIGPTAPAAAAPAVIVRRKRRVPVLPPSN
ncbi:MAG TPA: hypothetical protein VLJ57_24985 [Burkholderiaceae bacterium]|nr:hypothetical protein [Burkholderiaceae bacterium]